MCLKEEMPFPKIIGGGILAFKCLTISELQRLFYIEFRQIKHNTITKQKRHIFFLIHLIIN